MQSSEAVSRFTVSRYRTRVLMARLSIGMPTTFELANLILAIIGAWSVFYQLVKHLLPSAATASGLTVTGLIASLLIATLFWQRIARRPQDIFRSAARSEEAAEAIRRAMIDGMTHDFAYENVARLYAPTIDQISTYLPNATVSWPTDASGRKALVLTIAPTSSQPLDTLIADLEGPHSADWTTRVSRFAAERQAFMVTMRRGVALSNQFGDEAGTNVVLARVSAGARINLSVNTATYGQIVRTCDSLINEFAMFSHLASRSAFRHRPKALMFRREDLLKVLPWRRQVHSWDDEDALLIAPRRRASGIGVAMTLLEVVDDRAFTFVARRSSNVGTYPDVLHVIPAGMMNAYDDIHQPGSLAALPRLAMMAEFLEECFDVEELSGHAAGNFAKRVQDKLATFNVGDLEPAFTGLAIDLLNLRTDVCGLLDLSGRRQVLDAFQLSWEYTRTERLRRIELDGVSPALKRTDFVQSGLGSIDLARAWVSAQRATTGAA